MILLYINNNHYKLLFIFGYLEEDMKNIENVKSNNNNSIYIKDKEDKK